ncbi:hypothetical protein [Niabella hibiscisoli]|uniref:hypothetical protein n=1 Tax=Niabella hibiscisoli TaxID=1825928 RepID=UPI001F10AD36|nr:hypothetical protein [Niabella hibiscisoli]MCH5721261.1 hypothetical protein [Niabella hibiscisoli]
MDTDEFGDEYVEKLKVYLVNNSKAVYKFDYKLTFLETQISSSKILFSHSRIFISMM